MRILSINKELELQGFDITNIKERDLRYLDSLEYDYCFISGGDGTIRRTISFFYKHDKTLPFIIDTAGSFNVLHKALRCDRSDKILQKLQEGKTPHLIKKDLFAINEEDIFLFSAGSSLDVIYITLAEMLRFSFMKSSKLRYFISIVTLLPAILLLLPLFLFSKRDFFIFQTGIDLQIGSIYLSCKEMKRELKSGHNLIQLDGDLEIISDSVLEFSKVGKVPIVKS